MPDNVLTRPEAGGTLVQTPEAAAALAATQGLQPASPEGVFAERARERRRKMFDTTGDAVLTLAEGVVDAFSSGLLRFTGEEADIRREVNSTEAFAGQVIGTAGAVLTMRGPAALVNRAGEAAGKAAAKGLLRQAEGTVVNRALMEAGAGTALAGAMSFNHALLDTVIEDRPFAGETVLADAKLGGLFGLGAGGLVGVLGKVSRSVGGAKAPTRADVGAQGGLAGGVDDVLDHFQTARASYGEALHFHEAQLGALKEFRRAGKLADVSDDFIRVRSDAVARARAAQKAIQEVNLSKALDGSDPAAFKNLQRRWGEYSRAMDEVDDIMRPHSAEVSGVQALREPGTGVHPVTRLADSDIIPVVKPGDDFVVKAGEVGEAIPDSAAYARGVLPDQVGGMAGKAGGQTAVESLGNLGDPKFLKSTTDFIDERGGVNIGGEIAQMFKGARAAAGKPVSKGAMVEAAAEGLPTGVPGGLVELDAAIAKIPLKSGPASGAAADGAARSVLNMEPPATATVVESVPYGRVAKQLDALEAAEKTTARDLRRQVKAGIDEATKPEALNERLLDNWLGTYDQARVRPWNEAQAQARSAMEALFAKAGDRLTSARSLGILEADGIKPSADMVGSYMDSVYSMNRAVRHVADEARGVATPLRRAGMDAIAGAVGLKLLGKAGLGPGFGLVAAMTGYGGRLAAAAGRLTQRVTGAVEKFMSSTKIRSVAVAAANTPWAYSERGPIADPVERIQEIQFLAANPDAIRARIAEVAGDLAIAAPQHVAALQDAAVRQMTHLAIRAPAIYFDKLGRPLMPPQGKLRQFFEYENGVNDLEGLLKALETGSMTQPQADALQTAWTSVHVKASSALMMDPARLQSFTREKLRMVEMLTGMSLTASKDPQFLLRQQAVWAQASAPQQQPANRPQAFNINPDGAPTPSQANAQGRAPGN